MIKLCGSRFIQSRVVSYSFNRWPESSVCVRSLVNVDFFILFTGSCWSLLTARVYHGRQIDCQSSRHYTVHAGLYTPGCDHSDRCWHPSDVTLITRCHGRRSQWLPLTLITVCWTKSADGAVERLLIILTYSACGLLAGMHADCTRAPYSASWWNHDITDNNLLQIIWRLKYNPT